MILHFSKPCRKIILAPFELWQCCIDRNTTLAFRGMLRLYCKMIAYLNIVGAIMDIEEAADKELEVSLHWMAAHAGLC